MGYLENTNTGTCPAVLHKTRLPPLIPKVRWRQSVKRIITIEGFKSGWGHDRQEQGSQPPAGAKKIPGDVNTEYRDQQPQADDKASLVCVAGSSAYSDLAEREHGKYLSRSAFLEPYEGGERFH